MPLDSKKCDEEEKKTSGPKDERIHIMQPHN
jgi:hypothetical protein